MVLEGGREVEGSGGREERWRERDGCTGWVKREWRKGRKGRKGRKEREGIRRRSLERKVEEESGGGKWRRKVEEEICTATKQRHMI